MWITWCITLFSTFFIHRICGEKVYKLFSPHPHFYIFPVFIDLGMQQPLSGLLCSGDDIDGIGWINTGVEAADGMEGKKTEREEQTGVFSRIEK